VMNVKTGEILAMVSYPDYDASVFNPDTLIFNPQAILEGYQNDIRRPLLNRATRGRYPLGSVFKIFTMVVALDSGVWTPDRKVVCDGTWDGSQYGDKVRNDWQKPPGHGELNMHYALVNSCNPYFWTIGATLNQYDPNILPHGIQEFGFGSAPPLQGVETDEGSILDPVSKPVVRGSDWSISDAINMAIGQDVVGVNPLQVVTAVSAVANNGTLYEPMVVSRIETNGQVTQTYSTKGKQLSFDKGVLQQTRDAMCDVTTEAQAGETDMSYGTAEFMFGEWEELLVQMGTPITICAKTGTAESGSDHPHAWFGAYSPAENPEIAIVVMVENSCEGSEVSAPITRRILERYYGADPGYGWPSLWDTGCTPIGPEVSGP
jgi:penicillin-binding protein 2